MFTGIGGVSIFNKKGITLIEVLVTIAILSVAILSIFIFNIKVKNKTAVENDMMDVFYNNVAAYEIIQKELNLTGNIDYAVTKAIEETKGLSGKYVKTLNVTVNPVIICSDDVDILTIEPSATPVDENNDGVVDYYKKDSVLYYKSGVVSPKFNLSYNIPIYKITINTYLGTKKWDKLAITTLVCQNGGINVYEE